MKQAVLFFGVILLSTVLFISNTTLDSEHFTDIESLFSINTANAESGSKKCYDSIQIGNAYLVYFCLDCRQKSTDNPFDEGTCG